ncbi:MAG: LpxI family protein [Alphaproteobacteria bacterium]|nr:MAG: LpxI family protein [Alphaproteobacteria bacterium]
MPASAQEASPLAIIAGGGSVPIAVARAVERSGRRVVLFAVRGWADPAAVQKLTHHWLALVQAGRFLRLARAEGCREVVFVGTALRPPFRSLRIDWLTLRLLPRIARAYRGGDDHLLTSIARGLEDYGFRVVGAHEVAPEILMPEGLIGSLRPSERDRADIARALALLAATGPFDMGQAAVVAGNQVLAVEAAEGTDAMLARIAELRAGGRVTTPLGTGVLVKAPKLQQDRRFDLPAIGPRTVEEAARAGLAGIAVVAGGSIVAEPAALAAAADKAKIFVVGINADRPTQ